MGFYLLSSVLSGVRGEEKGKGLEKVLDK